MGACDDVRVAVQATLAWEEEGRLPRAQRGPVAGATTKFSLAPSIGVFTRKVHGAGLKLRAISLFKQAGAEAAAITIQTRARSQSARRLVQHQRPSNSSSNSLPSEHLHPWDQRVGAAFLSKP